MGMLNENNLTGQQQRFCDYLIAADDLSIATLIKASDSAGYVVGKGKYISLMEKEKIRNHLTSRGLDIKLKQRPLTDQQLAFVDHYMACFNPQVAALEAGYGTKQDGQMLLQKIQVREEIQKRQEELKGHTQISAARVLLEYARIGFADMGNFVEVGEDEHGIFDVRIKPLDQVDSAVISEIVQGRHGPTIKLHSKLKALDSISKYLGLFTEKVELTGKDGSELTIVNPADSLMAVLDKMQGNQQLLESNEELADKSEVDEVKTVDFVKDVTQ